jgi:DnaJ-class molecular chaperone
MKKKKVNPQGTEEKAQGRGICQMCNGSGQLSLFKGVSRFLLSWEECPECGGLGYIISDAGSITRRKQER